MGSPCCAGLACVAGACAACLAEGAACAIDSDCCDHLPCLDHVCHKLCSVPGGACAIDADCCDGKTCEKGVCGDPPPCTPDGQPCLTGAECCGMSCYKGSCGPCPMAYACADFLQGNAGASDLCGEALSYYGALLTCLCSGACQASCAGNFCTAQNPTQACVDCAQSQAGCGAAYEACSAH
ncbi:MAG: hypothetical protein U0359_29740 [Byssovorax sp.]